MICPNYEFRAGGTWMEGVVRKRLHTGNLNPHMETGELQWLLFPQHLPAPPNDQNPLTPQHQTPNPIY